MPVEFYQCKNGKYIPEIIEMNYRIDTFYFNKGEEIKLTEDEVNEISSNPIMYLFDRDNKVFVDVNSVKLIRILQLPRIENGEISKYKINCEICGNKIRWEYKYQRYNEFPFDEDMVRHRLDYAIEGKKIVKIYSKNGN